MDRAIGSVSPRDSRAARWSEGGAPADRRDPLRRWDRLHHLRLAVIIAAFALLAASATTLTERYT